MFLSMKTHWFLVLFFWRGGCLWEIPRTHPASSWWRRAAQHGVPFLGIFGGLWFRSSWTGFGFTNLQVRKLKSKLKNESLANENHWIWLFVYWLFPVVDFSLALIFLREFPWDQPNRPDQEISSFKLAWSQNRTWIVQGQPTEKFPWCLNGTCVWYMIKKSLKCKGPTQPIKKIRVIGVLSTSLDPGWVMAMEASPHGSDEVPARPAHVVLASLAWIIQAPNLVKFTAKQTKSCLRCLAQYL